MNEALTDAGIVIVYITDNVLKSYVVNEMDCSFHFIRVGEKIMNNKSIGPFQTNQTATSSKLLLYT
jgi:hypothetical protein